jgi:hypothetical protein
VADGRPFSFNGYGEPSTHNTCNDRLPIGGSDESIMRFDQVQAIGPARTAIDILPHRLSDEALAFVDEWMIWYVRRDLLQGGPLHSVRELLISQ